jgi:hypothetical protein
MLSKFFKKSAQKWQIFSSKASCERSLFFLILCFPVLCSATNLKPWFGNVYELEIRTTFLYQNYAALASHCGTFSCNANDLFITLSMEYPFRRYSGEFEVTGAWTHFQHRRCDNFRATGRYQWLNDIQDPFSLVTGLTVTQPFSSALHDVSSFHHGHIEGEAHLSFGKKYGGIPCSRDYRFRWWSVVGIGIAEIGKPWLRVDAACEYNHENFHHLRLSMDTLWGQGHKPLVPLYFKGYGPIGHQSIDIGLRYGYTIDCWGTLSLQYARRVYAKNFPENVDFVIFRYYLPFGFQSPTTY